MKKIVFILSLYFLLLLAYGWLSYALTSPNLVLSSADWYWRYQMHMWATFYNNRPLLTYYYAGLISLITLIYCALLLVLKRQTKIPTFPTFGFYLLIISPLIFASNALSYDIFNYIFNAKMLVIYHANPHLHTALEFAFDPWVRFMHNIHTPAPYGYGWTG